MEEQLADKNAEVVTLEAIAESQREQQERTARVEENCEELEARCKSLEELEERRELNEDLLGTDHSACSSTWYTVFPEKPENYIPHRSFEMDQMSSCRLKVWIDWMQHQDCKKQAIAFQHFPRPFEV